MRSFWGHFQTVCLLVFPLWRLNKRGVKNREIRSNPRTSRLMVTNVWKGGNTYKKKSWLLDSSMSLRKLEYKQASFSASFNYTMLLSWKSRLTALFYSCAFGHRFIFCNATSSVPGNCYHSFLDKQRRTKWILNEQLKKELWLKNLLW